MKVSIITIVYNNKNYIADCIQTLQSQDYSDIEHIVIDGGSTDGTQSVIEPFRDKLGYYISEPDNGLYNALNKGIKRATGDIIGILHSDDLLPNNSTISDVVSAFKNSKADVVYANGQYVARENITKVKRFYGSKTCKHRYFNWGWIPLHTTIYVKKQLFSTHGYYDESFRIASDYDISLRWLKDPSVKSHFYDQTVVTMRLGGKSTTTALQKKKSKEDLIVIRRHGLAGYFTLGCKILRKVPQYLLPRLFPFKFKL